MNKSRLKKIAVNISILIVSMLFIATPTFSQLPKDPLPDYSDGVIITAFCCDDENVVFSESEIVSPANYTYSVYCLRDNVPVAGVWAFWGGDFNFRQEWLSVPLTNISINALIINASTEGRTGGILYFEKEQGVNIWHQVASRDIKTREGKSN
ncbi:MAG: hypothetical protein WCX74_00245 [Candidatus Paceibacterota bacterium]